VTLLGAACDSDDPPPPQAEATPTPTPAPKPDPVCPLTGRALPKGVSAGRPAVALKVENPPEARPQSGLEHADVVFEEIVEGGITRFMAIYHCKDSKKVGPIRSARFDDAKIALPFTRILGFSGGNSIVERELRERKMIAIQELFAPQVLYRVPPGVLDLHNVFADTKKLRNFPKRHPPGPRRDIFEFGKLQGNPAKARSVELHFRSTNTIEYRYKKGKWRRFEAGRPFTTTGGGQIAVPNVLIQEVEVNNSRTIVDSAGNPSPDIKLVGKGRAVLFRDGRAIRGTWRIRKEAEPTRFTTKAGDPMVFKPGPVWIALVPSRKGNVKGSFSYR
jgi:hypothetical protein